MSNSDAEVELYLSEIARFKLLTPAEERELAYRIARGDNEARDRMIRANLRLVVSIAKNYTERGMPFLDLIEEGNLGLLKAVGRFSPDQGCKFSTYASWWIKQTIRRALINKVKSVRVPAYMIEVLTRWKRTASSLAQKLGRDATADEIGRALKLTPSKITIVRLALSASAPVGRTGDDENSFDFDLLPGAPSAEESSSDLLGDFDRETLRSAVEFALTERERQVIELRYGLHPNTAPASDEPCTLERIGERIGLTRERVRQIENQALRKLQIFLEQKDEREELQRRERRRHREEALTPTPATVEPSEPCESSETSTPTTKAAPPPDETRTQPRRKSNSRRITAGNRQTASASGETPQDRKSGRSR